MQLGIQTNVQHARTTLGSSLGRIGDTMFGGALNAALRRD